MHNITGPHGQNRRFVNTKRLQEKKTVNICKHGLGRKGCSTKFKEMSSSIVRGCIDNFYQFVPTEICF